MDLLATGFNAWRQLDDFRTSPDRTDVASFEASRIGDAQMLQSRPIGPEPDDIYEFTLRLSGHEVCQPISRLFYTLVKDQGVILKAGVHGDTLSTSEELARDYQSVVNGHGYVLELGDRNGNPIAVLSKGNSQRTELRLGSIQQVTAYKAGFAVLTADGCVWTCGDERFPHCRAWDPDSSSEGWTDDVWGDSWNRVGLLQDVPQGPIAKIAAGGYTLGALTRGGDLYLWGQRTSLRPVMPRICGTPMPVDLEDDVVDFAIGLQHIVLLTTKGAVMVRGSNKNGQLGLGKSIEWEDDWRKVELQLKDGQRMVGVSAGDKTSFILTKHVGTGDLGSCS